MSRHSWDSRYDRDDYIYGVQPSRFLRENAGLLSGHGLALDLAAGEGRNAVYLADLGYSVVALDISRAALEKCRRLAVGRNVVVETAVVDLETFTLPRETFDLVLNVNFLLRDLAPAIVDGLKPGGIVVFETMTQRQLKWKPDFNPEFLLKPGELLEMLKGVELMKYREMDIEEGTTPRSVASLIGRKVW